VEDPKLLMVGVLVLSHWSADEILQSYQLSQSQLIGLLARLDKLRIIDLLPGNRIKLRLARNFTWRKSGPIQRFFEQRVQQQFFDSSFVGPGELRITVLAASHRAPTPCFSSACASWQKSWMRWPKKISASTSNRAPATPWFSRSVRGSSACSPSCVAESPICVRRPSLHPLGASAADLERISESHA